MTYSSIYCKYSDKSDHAFTAWYRTVNRMSKRISFLPVFDKYGAVFYADSGVAGVGSTLKNALYVRDIEGIGYVGQITLNAGWLPGWRSQP